MAQRFALLEGVLSSFSETGKWTGGGRGGGAEISAVSHPLLWKPESWPSAQLGWLGQDGEDLKRRECTSAHLHARMEQNERCWRKVLASEADDENWIKNQSEVGGRRNAF